MIRLPKGYHLKKGNEVGRCHVAESAQEVDVLPVTVVDTPCRLPVLCNRNEVLLLLPKCLGVGYLLSIGNEYYWLQYQYDATRTRCCLVTESAQSSTTISVSVIEAQRHRCEFDVM